MDMAFTRESLEQRLMDVAMVNGINADLIRHDGHWHELSMDMDIKGTECKGWLSMFCVDTYKSHVVIGVTQMEITCKYEDIESIEFNADRRIVIKFTNGMDIRTLRFKR